MRVEKHIREQKTCLSFDLKRKISGTDRGASQQHHVLCVSTTIVAPLQKLSAFLIANCSFSYFFFAKPTLFQLPFRHTFSMIALDPPCYPSAANPFLGAPPPPAVGTCPFRRPSECPDLGCFFPLALLSAPFCAVNFHVNIVLL